MTCTRRCHHAILTPSVLMPWLHAKHAECRPDIWFVFLEFIGCHQWNAICHLSSIIYQGWMLISGYGVSAQTNCWGRMFNGIMGWFIQHDRFLKLPSAVSDLPFLRKVMGAQMVGFLAYTYRLLTFWAWVPIESRIGGLVRKVVVDSVQSKVVVSDRHCCLVYTVKVRRSVPTCAL